MEQTVMKTDKAAIGLSVLCVVHCLVTPIAIVMFPALGATFLEDESFHYVLLFLVLPTSLFSLGLGCRKHGHRDILLLGIFGLFILSLILLVGEETLGELGEKLSTVVGAVVVASAHFRNFKACQVKKCHSTAES
mgnify:CR=1 FL=1|tara:strand:- start:770 stop:1174 length:405 start_codon:yes stop_codon:yes gene_type:complete